MLMTRDGAQRLQNHAFACGDVLVWTIYERPADFPDHYIARPFSIRSGGPLNQYLLADDLSAIRHLLPAGLVRYDRHAKDHAEIVETWL